jgi:hypothetical protein
LFWALVAAGIMTLTLGVLSSSPEERTQGHEAADGFELVDFRPPDADGDGMTPEEPDGDASDETSTEDSDEDSATDGTDGEDSEFTYENCAAARDDGAAPVHEGDHGFGPHLDADDDGIGCEEWGTSDGDTESDQGAYENCTEAREDGAAPINEGEPGFGPHLDADDDGIGCEEWGTSSETPDGAAEDNLSAYENCAAARAEGAAPINEGEPGFGPHLDADNDGIGCEQ